MYLARKRRVERLFNLKDQRTLIIPMDHGLTLGPIAGIESMAKAERFLTSRDLSGIVAHRGVLERLQAKLNLSHLALLMHLNGASSLGHHSDDKQLLTDVESALRLGVDGLSLQINFTANNDQHNLQMLGRVVSEADAQGLPVLTMLYDKAGHPNNRVTRMRQLIRQCIELGSSIIKIAPPENLQELSEILADLKEDVAIVVAGGALVNEGSMMQLVTAAVNAGARGVCVGRNVFERTDAKEFISRLKGVIERENIQIFPRVALAVGANPHV